MNDTDATITLVGNTAFLSFKGAPPAAAAAFHVLTEDGFKWKAEDDTTNVATEG